MKRSTKLLAILALLTIALTNCSKDRIQPPLNTYGSLNQFYNTYKQPEQEYIINAGGNCPLIAQQGLKLCADINDLAMPNGDSVQYPYSIKIIELYTPRDMILYNMPTVAGGDLLTTGGEIRVRAFKGTDELHLRAGRAYLAQVPAQNPTPAMDIFAGYDNGTFIDWNDSITTSSGGPMSITIDTSNAYYNMVLPFTGWINCDYFYSYTGQKTQISFTSTTDDLTNVAKFLYFPTINSVMQVYGNTSGDVPVGVPVKVLCFAADGSGNMYYYYNPVNISSGQSENVVMGQTTEAALLSLMAGL